MAISGLKTGGDNGLAVRGAKTADNSVRQGDVAFALDHLTIVDADPTQLAQVAARNGYRAICLFMESMAVLPQMPDFTLFDQPADQRALRQILGDGGVKLDVAYPFTLSRKSELEDFKRGLACAAFLGARFANVLIYEREAGRAAEKFSDFCALAENFDLGVVLEFFPASAVPTLADALSMVSAIARPHKVGVNVDLLHLMRSGGTMEDLRRAPGEYILYGQLCDGLADAATDRAARDYEASMERLLPGQGAFDVVGFCAALPAHCPISLEIPQVSAIQAGISRDARARRTMHAARAAMAV